MKLAALRSKSLRRMLSGIALIHPVGAFAAGSSAEHQGTDKVDNGLVYVMDTVLMHAMPLQAHD